MSRMASLLSKASAVVLGVTFSHSVYAQASPSNFTWATRYDGLGRIVGTIAPDVDGVSPFAYGAVRNTYDNSGQLIKVEQGELSSWKAEVA